MQAILIFDKMRNSKNTRGVSGMSKKDKKIEIYLSDAKVIVNNVAIEGYQLNVSKKMIGEIVELDERFAVVNNGKVDAFYKQLDQAIEKIIENYNLNH